VPTRRLVPALLAVVALLAALVGCAIGPSDRPDLAVYGGPASSGTGTSDAGRPTGAGGPGQNAQFEPGWGGCSGLPSFEGRAAEFTMECAAIRVPYDYSQPTAGRLNLAVGRASAPGLPGDAPPLVVLVNDGPLDATLENVDRLPEIAAALPSAITDHFAIIGIDVRGSGSSAAGVDCFYDYPVDVLFTMNADQTTSAAQSYLNELSRVFTFGCQDSVDADMVFFNSAQVADDLDSLRSALGRDTLDLLGIGYGATAAAVYVDRYPGRAGRVVLDGPTDHGSSPTDRAVTSAEQFERALQTFLADCASRADCGLGADPAGTVQAAIDRLDHDPLSDSSLMPNSSAVLWALVMALPDRTQWPDLVRVIAAAAEDDADPLATYLTDLLEDPPARVDTRLMLGCNDTDQRISDADLATATTDAAAKAPTFGSFLVAVAALCKLWPAPETPLGLVHGTGAPTVLVIGGVDDPVAPFGGVQAVASQLSSAVLVNYSGLGHGGYLHSDCIAALVNPFLTDGTVPAPGTLCAR
jgi:pimeloyl-ACP methyl ester carboxylesterase